MTLRAILIAAAVALAPLSAAADGVLYFSPERAQYAIGDTFQVDILADSGGVQLNAAEADISFNPAALQVVSIDTDASALSLWPTPAAFSNSAGTIRFSGSASNPFSGNKIVLASVVFKAISTLPGDMRFDSGALLLNDARATNILATMRSALFTIRPAQAAPAPQAESEATSSAATELQPEVKGASIQIPKISGYDDRVAPGTRIVLQGSAAPDSMLTVYLKYENEAPSESSLYAAKDGSFTYVSSQLAREGTYTAWASIGDDAYKSDTVTVTATSPGFAAAVLALGPYVGFALPIVLLMIAAGFAAGFALHKRSVR